MKLNLVDRRTAADGTSAAFHGENWEQLQRLCAGIGGSDWNVNVVLVADKDMADLNRRFRDKPGVTDVLSFSYLEDEGRRTPDLAAGEHYAAADIWLEDGPEVEAAAVCGELILAPAFVASRCKEMGWSLSAEIVMLVVHGCLHLLGWDHLEAVQQQAMQAHEVNILAGEGLSHPLRQRS